MNPVRYICEPTVPSRQTINIDSDPASTFTDANAGGRELVYTAGVAAVGGPEAAPVGVPAKAGAFTKRPAVALNTAVASSTDRKASYRFAQTADNPSVVQEAADCPPILSRRGTFRHSPDLPASYSRWPATGRPVFFRKCLLARRGAPGTNLGDIFMFGKPLRLAAYTAGAALLTAAAVPANAASTEGMTQTTYDQCITDEQTGVTFCRTGTQRRIEIHTRRRGHPPGIG